jgi:fluoride exporter
MSCFLVFIGGGIGALMRFILSLLINSNTSSSFPYPTLCVNLMGCFMAGMIAQYLMLKYPDNLQLKYLLITGILGGFTTFSAFALENMAMIERQQFMQAFIYTSFSVIGGLALAIIGSAFTKYITSYF